LIKLIF